MDQTHSAQSRIAIVDEPRPAGHGSSGITMVLVISFSAVVAGAGMWLITEYFLHVQRRSEMLSVVR